MLLLHLHRNPDRVLFGNQTIQRPRIVWISTKKHTHSLKCLNCGSNTFKRKWTNMHSTVKTVFSSCCCLFFSFLCLMGTLDVPSGALHKVIHVCIIAHRIVDGNLIFFDKRNAWMITVINCIRTKKWFSAFPLRLCKQYPKERRLQWFFISFDFFSCLSCGRTCWADLPCLHLNLF